jgi:hypothetical protein
MVAYLCDEGVIVGGCCLTGLSRVSLLTALLSVSPLGVAIVLDLSLLLTVPAAEIYSFLQQLHSIRPLLPDRSVVGAFVQQVHLERAAEKHLQAAHEWHTYLDMMAGRAPGALCSLIEKGNAYLSRTVDPPLTHDLRNAYKVGWVWNFHFEWQPRSEVEAWACGLGTNAYLLA